jgi:iron(III) transport system ATP-binding protein
MPSLTVTALRKTFGEFVALDDVSFTVAEGELFTLLGPSGCGKTTTLQAIAGFVRPDCGVVNCGRDTFLDTSNRINIPAERRNLGIVFQSYAVWPNMTVAANVEFPLKLRKLPAHVRKQQVSEALELVELGELAARYPHQLSGGQRQRVALARALVYRPSLLLLDEPFSNLDAKLRERARTWLKELQLSLGITTIFVTHDQEEALSLSDRVLVMRAGHVLRVGTAEEVYADPRDQFVAEFIGQCNFLSGALERNGTGTWLHPDLVPARIRLAGEAHTENGRVTAAIRPEDIEIRSVGDGDLDWIAGEIAERTYLGTHLLYTVRTRAGRMTVRSTRRFTDPRVELRVREGAASIVNRAGSGEGGEK